MPILKRSVRSFVLRQGRFSLAQRAELDHSSMLSERFSAQAQCLTPSELRSLPRELEIGFGMGDQLIHRCAHYPAIEFLGVEVHLPGIASCLKKAKKQNLLNLKILRIDALELLKQFKDSEHFRSIWILFPDPWPKKKQRKRRLLNEETLTLIASSLAPQGKLLIKTDWHDYAEAIEQAINASQLFQKISEDSFSHSQAQITTKYAKKAVEAQRSIRAFYLQKRRNF